MKNFDALLEIAEIVCDCFRGTATAGTTSSVTETELAIPTGTFNGGTLFITSGTYAGSIRKITTQAEGVIKFSPVLVGALVVNDTFMAARADNFPLRLLRQALNLSLRDYNIPAYDETLLYDPDLESQTLPTGVSNVKTVEIATYSTTPYHFIPIHGWKEENGKLYIYGGAYAEDDDHPVRLTYVKKAGEYLDSATWDITIHLNRVKWEAAAWLYRNYYTRIEKDNPILQDLLSQAMDEAAKEKIRSAHLHPLPKRDIRTSRWAS